MTQNAIYIKQSRNINISPTVDTNSLITDPAGPGKGHHVYAWSTDGSVQVKVTLDGGDNQANIVVMSSVDKSATLTILNEDEQDFMVGCYVGSKSDGSYCTMKGNDTYLKANIRSSDQIEVVVPKGYEGYITIMGSARLNHTMGSDVQQVLTNSAKSQYSVNGGDWEHTIKVTMPDGATVGLRYSGT